MTQIKISVNKDDSTGKQSKIKTRLVNPCTITYDVNSTLVDCSNRNITNLQSLDLPLNTTWLDLSNNSISSICNGSFEHLSSLKCLNFSYNKGFSILDREAFKGLTNLTTLNMTGVNNPSDVYIYNGTFGFLPQLTQLIINDWTGHTFAHLKNFQDVICDLNKQNIQEIQANGINTFDTVWVMQDPLFACLKQANLQKLVMRENYIVSIMPPVLDYLRNLRHLDLSHNFIIGGDYRLLTFDLEMMTQLETFNMSYQSYVNVTPNIYPDMGNLNMSPSNKKYQENSLQQHQRLCKHNISLPANLTWMDISHRNSFLQGPLFSGICVNGNNSLKTLFFGDNNLKENIFGPVLHFPLLQALYLQGTRMVFTSYRMFEKLNKLQILIVRRCDLQRVIDSSHHGKDEIWQRIINNSILDSLKYLDMSSNGLIFLPKNLFKNLRNLKFIRLSQNLLSDMFFNITHLQKIKHLDLSFNRISHLPSNLLDMWPSVSFEVNLGHNHIFSGSCRDILPLRILVHAEKRDIKVSGVHLHVHRCRSSDVNCYYKTMIKKCHRTYTPFMPFIFYMISIVLIGLTSFGIMFKPRYIYAWRYFKLLLHKYQEDTRDPSELEYDAFVCYSHKDYNWVVRILMPILENIYGYRLCIHERDFEPGAFIDVNIMQSFQKSKSAILVITKQSLRSSFLNFELHIAREQAMNVICVFLEKPNTLLNQRLPPTLEYFIQTQTYICWPTDETEQVNFWRRLVKALGKPLDEERHANVDDNQSIYDIEFPT